MTRPSRFVPRSVHLWTAAGCAVAAIVLAHSFEELSSSADRIFATVTGAIGVYAAIFAIIELLRLGSVADLVNQSVDEMADSIQNLASVKNFQDCQQTVDRLARIIDAGEASPFSIIHDLVKSYTYCFPEEMVDDTSVHRKNKSQLELFCLAVTQKDRKSGTQLLRPTVLSITSHLSGATAGAVNRRPPNIRG